MIKEKKQKRVTLSRVNVIDPKLNLEKILQMGSINKKFYTQIQRTLNF